MKNLNKRAINILLVLALLITIFGVFGVTPVQAGELLIYDGILLKTVEAGQLFTHTVTIQSGANDPELEMIVDIGGLGQNLDGSYCILSGSDDISKYSARDFIKEIDLTSFVLQPGTDGAQPVTAIIKVPDDVDPGTYYGAIYIHSKPTGDTQVGVVLAAYVPIVLTVPGAQQDLNGQIIEMSMSEITAGEIITVDTVVQNEGNYYFKAKERITLKDEAEETIAQTLTNLTSSSIIPDNSFRFSVALPLSEGLTEGTYFVESEILTENGDIIDTREIEFSLENDYEIPPENVPSGNIAGVEEPESSTPVVWIFAFCALAVIAVAVISVLVIKLRQKS